MLVVRSRQVLLTSDERQSLSCENGWMVFAKLSTFGSDALRPRSMLSSSLVLSLKSPGSEKAVIMRSEALHRLS